MNIDEIKQVIKAAVYAQDAVLVEGKHGIGKSEGAKEFAQEENFHYEPLFLSHQEIGDLIGIPDKMTDGDVTITIWSIPPWLQRIYKAAERGQKSILVLEELNRAQQDVLQSALQLVLEGQIHEHHLPIVDGLRTTIVATINPSSDYQVNELDPALLDRFIHVFGDVDAKSWLNWARKKNVNKIIRDFISEHPDRLWWMPKDGGDGATPRSWTKLGNYINNMKEIPNEILYSIMKGKVGTEIGSQFHGFLKNYVDVIKVEDIEKIVNDNKEKFKNIDDLAALISDKMAATEAIQKSEMAHQLADKYMVKNDILVFLAYLYSLEIEICVSFLKGYRKDEPKKYKKLAQIDTELNNKLLFKRIVKAADNE
jgi:hypothetical protein